MHGLPSNLADRLRPIRALSRSCTAAVAVFAEHLGIVTLISTVDCGHIVCPIMQCSGRGGPLRER